MRTARCGVWLNRIGWDDCSWKDRTVVSPRSRYPAGICVITAAGVRLSR